MSITDYASLQTKIGSWLNRSDLTAEIPTFIQLAEAKIGRTLRHFNMEKRATADLDSRYTEVPVDFVQPIRLHVTGKGPLSLTGQEDMQIRRDQACDTAGTPLFYALVGGEFEVFPSPDSTYTLEMSYYGKIDALSDSNTTNWLLNDAPDVYLYGALMQTAPFLMDDARLTVWAALLQSGIDELNLASKRAKTGGGGLKMRVNK